jgi:hypothetical protein
MRAQYASKHVGPWLAAAVAAAAAAAAAAAKKQRDTCDIYREINIAFCIYLLLCK